jgi:competence protein ComEA
MPLNLSRAILPAVAGVALLLGGSAAGMQTQVMRAPGYYLPPTAPKPADGARGSSGRSSLLDLNTATMDQLAGLPGMGRVYARRVIEGRPYHAKNQIVRRGILPAAEYARIRDLVVAHRATAGGAQPAASRAER